MRSRSHATILAALGVLLVAGPADASCLPASGHVGIASIRGVRVGSSASVRDASGQPVRVSAASYCVAGGGSLSLAFSPDSEVLLVVSTAAGDALGPVGPGDAAAAAVRHFGAMRRVLASATLSVYQPDPHRQVVFGVARGRVAFVAAVDRLLLAQPGKLAYWLARVGAVAQGG